MKRVPPGGKPVGEIIVEVLFICFQTQYGFGTLAYADGTFINNGVAAGPNVQDFICS